MKNGILHPSTLLKAWPLQYQARQLRLTIFLKQGHYYHVTITKYFIDSTGGRQGPLSPPPTWPPPLPLPHICIFKPKGPSSLALLQCTLKLKSYWCYPKHKFLGKIYWLIDHDEQSNIHDMYFHFKYCLRRHLSTWLHVLTSPYWDENDAQWSIGLCMDLCYNLDYKVNLTYFDRVRCKYPCQSLLKNPCWSYDRVYLKQHITMVPTHDWTIGTTKGVFQD